MKRPFPLSPIAALLLALPVLAGCAGRFDLGAAPAARPDGDGERAILDVSRVLQDGWRHLPVRGTTDFRIAIVDRALAVSATGAGGASGLIRPVEADPERCRTLRWQWRVDLRTKQGDDVGASVFVLFGDPGMMSAPTAVPTLKYVWAGGDLQAGEMLPNPYLPDSVMNVVVATADAPLGQWRWEERDLLADYEAAFGGSPEDWIHAIALFTDNDQTGEAVAAHYRSIRLRCDG